MKKVKMTKKRDDLLGDFLKEQIKKTKYKAGDIVKIHRERLGLTQLELATITNIPAGNISLYETNKKTIGFSVALKLSMALAIHHDSILFPNGIEAENSELAKIKEKASKVFLQKDLMIA